VCCGVLGQKGGGEGFGEFSLFLTLFKLTNQIINTLKIFKIKIILKNF
jgi:hypothetical protein